MIRYQDAELTSVLPYYIKADSDVQAISYAYRMAMRNIFRYSKWAMLYANIDELPNEILDLLALEVRAPYYDESMDIEIKRNIIRNSMSWYITGGTVFATEEMVRAVFGEGNVVEWYQFDGAPGEFYIETNEELSPDTVKKFNEVIDKVKNKRSKLIKVVVKRKNSQELYLATCNRNCPHVVVYDHGLNNVWANHFISVHNRKVGTVVVTDAGMGKNNL